SVHKPVPAQERYCGTLSYMGTRSADREAALQMLFVEPAINLPASRFMLDGAEYGTAFPCLPNIFFVDHLPPQEHAALYCSSALTLNVTRGPMASMGYCPSGRLFEAAACGLPILSDSWEGLDSFYEPGSEILIARSTEEAIEAIRQAP